MSSVPGSPSPTGETNRGCYLSTTDLFRLDLACHPLWTFARKEGAGGVYLVGSANQRADFRDVDVRMMLSDEKFDALFGHSQTLWGVFCYAVSRWLSADTGLPVDFQVQRQTEANEKHSAPRNPVGRAMRDFAGGGDATRFGGEHVAVPVKALRQFLSLQGTTATADARKELERRLCEFGPSDG